MIKVGLGDQQLKKAVPRAQAPQTWLGPEIHSAVMESTLTTTEVCWKCKAMLKSTEAEPSLTQSVKEFSSFSLFSLLLVQFNC